jgi:hypothetical protein
MHALRVSVLALSVAAAALLVVSLGASSRASVERDDRLESHVAERAAAILEAQRARFEAELANARLVEIMADLDALDAQISRTVTAIADGQTADDRMAQSHRLQALQLAKADLKRRAAAARLAADRAWRTPVCRVHRECLERSSDPPLPETPRPAGSCG